MNRRGDARVHLISLAFLSTGGFLACTPLGDHGPPLLARVRGLQIANPVGLVLAPPFAFARRSSICASSALFVVRHRVALRRTLLGPLSLWFAWTVPELPPLDNLDNEGGSHPCARAWRCSAGSPTPSCSPLLARLSRADPPPPGQRIAASSSWPRRRRRGADRRTGRARQPREWHRLIVTAYAVVSYAARRQWHDERLRGLTCPPRASGRNR